MKMEPPLFDVTPAVRVLFLIPSRPAPKLAKAEKWSADFHAFIEQCLSKDPSKRPDAAAALESPFAANAEASRSPVLEGLVERYISNAVAKDSSFSMSASGWKDQTLRCDDTCGMGRGTGQGTLPRLFQPEQSAGGTLLHQPNFPRGKVAENVRDEFAADDTIVPSRDTVEAVRRTVPQLAKEQAEAEAADALGRKPNTSSATMAQAEDALSPNGFDQEFSFMDDYDHSGDEDERPGGGGAKAPLPSDIAFHPLQRFRRQVVSKLIPAHL
ncbi:MAG: hypothetical protein SGPRY_011425 [Prymnesium sp.]